MITLHIRRAEWLNVMSSAKLLRFMSQCESEVWSQWVALCNNRFPLPTPIVEKYNRALVGTHQYVLWSRTAQTSIPANFGWLGCQQSLLEISTFFEKRSLLHVMKVGREPKAIKFCLCSRTIEICRYFSEKFAEWTLRLTLHNWRGELPVGRIEVIASEINLNPSKYFVSNLSAR